MDVKDEKWELWCPNKNGKLTRAQIEEVDHCRRLDTPCPMYAYNQRSPFGVQRRNHYMIYYFFDYDRIAKSAMRFEACYKKHGALNYSYLTE